MQISLLNKIAATSSRAAKERYLADANEVTKAFLRLALDPAITFGVTLQASALKQFVGGSNLAAEKWWWDYRTLLERLAARTLTGHAALGEVLAQLGDAPTRDDAVWAVRVLNQDLSCGVSLKTVTKMFPNLISVFEVSLAFPYDPGKHTLNGVGYFEPKLDGVRLVVVGGVAFSRRGNVLESATSMLAELREVLAPERLEDWVFDGEFMGSGAFEDASGDIRRSGKEDRGLVFHVFDVVRYEEWLAKTTRNFSERRMDLEQLLVKAGRLVKVVPSQRVVDPTVTEALKIRDRFIARGFEGAMWKTDRPYCFGRSANILKLKSFESEDGQVIGAEEGRSDGAPSGVLGALVARIENGVSVKIGTGFTAAERAEFWKGRAKLIGKTVEFKFQNATKHGSRRHPVFIRFRDDK